MKVPRDEYPRPQFVRKDWICLNGEWEFEIDYNDSGLEQGFLSRPFSKRIIVPFCPESKLSGIGHVGFMDSVWYRRGIKIPESWEGKKIILHFQAVDYDATVWVNGMKLAQHRGGWSGFECDLSGVVEPGQRAEIVVRACDPRNDRGKPSGKQCNQRYENFGCFYNRTTGIWQTVWMEPLNYIHLNRPRITPDVNNSKFILSLPITNSRAGTKLRVTLKDSNSIILQNTQKADIDFTPTVELEIPAEKVKLWSCDNPFLYNIDIELLDENENILDSAMSYGGLRSISIDGKAVKINDKVVFQRLVLDQGYYPDGIMTAPTENDLKNDIELSMAAGFNGARLHQKAFEERFLYHCDRLGYLVWAEFGNWGIDTENPRATYITQWLEILNRDYSHPAIIGWCCLNEAGKDVSDSYDNFTDLALGMFLAAKSIDNTRPVIDVSGYSHRLKQTDIYDSHCYEQTPELFEKLHSGLSNDKPHENRNIDNNLNRSVPYNGQPYFCSEFGGIKWCTQTSNKANNRSVAWGYGKPAETEHEFYYRFKALCDVLLNNPKMFGYCYTQLTDTYQERNGIYYFDRKPKFDLKIIRQIQQTTAAIEKENSQKSIEIYLNKRPKSMDNKKYMITKV